MAKVNCSHCGKENDFSVRKVNQAYRENAPLYCNRVCFGLSKRSNKTISEKRKEKKEYDQKYRTENKEKMNARIIRYNESPLGRATQKRARKKVKESGYRKAYLSSEKYKEYKRKYDRNYNAKKNYGEFWESHLLIQDIENEYDNREVKDYNKLINKSKKRKRAWQNQKNLTQTI